MDHGSQSVRELIQSRGKSDMTVWIFISTITLFGAPIDLATGLEYAFTRREACEYAIAGSKTLRCVELKLVK